MMGVPNFLKGRECSIRFMFSDPDEIIDVKGTIVKVDMVEGRRDLVTAGIKFDENQVPLSYKLRINDFFSFNKKIFLESQEQENDPTKIIVNAKRAQELQAEEDARNGIVNAQIS